ncbi:MAG: 4-(cytidine 5'-diphospho)-2-C-methyl-D-erythritol kinase [Armatimonadetes bacterium]|nr:4-(cytidine 5'-diphospho)-2-C-methyl-D-erythritol kinase [Armatimonadota bacterium]
MKELRLNAYAKINLTLDVHRRREDGYHEIETVLHTVALHDTVVLRETGQGISVNCSDPSLPQDQRNLVYRTAQLLKETFKVERSVEIDLTKRIPAAAGMGGGSSDAAVTLLGLAQMWKLRLDRRQLLDLAARVGSDVPFFLFGGAALARGRGEKLQPLNPMPATWMVLARPPLEVSTPWAYRNLDVSSLRRRPETAKMVGALVREDVAAVGQLVCNVFEDLIVTAHSIVGELRDRMRSLGAFGAGMTGTGPTVFGFVPNEAAARWIAAELSAVDRGVDTMVTRTFAEAR